MMGRATTTWTFALINVVFIVVGASMAAASVYPVYESSRLVTVAAAAILVGAAIALACDRLGWGPLIGVALTAAAFVGLGLGLAIPGVTNGDVPLTVALRELVVGPVAGWMDIVTLPLPLGTFGATLVPILALLLGGTVLATWLALRSPRWWGAAALVIVVMVATAVLVGPTARAMPLTWAPYGMYVNREFVIGLVTFAVLLGWLVWRSAYARHRAVARSAEGARLASPPRLRVVSTAVAATVMALVAVGFAAVYAGPVAAETPRDVARAHIDPELVIDATVTPLAAYRSYFADETFDEVLFTVDVTEGDVDRVRIATLPYFTGDSFTASAPEGAVPARFERVPSGIAAPDSAEPLGAEVTIGALTGVWLPLVGELGSVAFHGDTSGVLLDSFFYQRETGSGLITAEGGVSERDSYGVDAHVSGRIPPLQNIGASPGGDVIDSSLIPASLTDWVGRQGVSHDGAGLAHLVDLLRERGYLSHGLSTGDTAPRWAAALGDYTFVASAAGHSYDRIDRMFAELSARESEVAGIAGGSLVAAIGDDEQFAAAVALVAAELGFPSRVVLGARLQETDAAGWTAPACVDGVCRGSNISVWTEVQGANGMWVPIDVTPQHTSPPAPEVVQQQDPKFASDIDPERAEPIAPPSSQRGSASETPPPPAAESEGWGWVLPVAIGTGVGLLVILIVALPMLAILAWKGLRRRRRRRADPRTAIHHGWDEYVDTAVDAGFSPLPLATRLEAAQAYASPNGERLARLTDAATFGTAVSDPDDAAAFWALVDAEREQWLSTRGRWARIRMRLSLRSVWNAVTVQDPQGTKG